MIKEQVWRINKISNDTIIHPNVIEMMHNNDLYSEEKSTIIIVTEDSNKIKVDVERSIFISSWQTSCESYELTEQKRSKLIDDTLLSDLRIFCTHVSAQIVLCTAV